MDQSASLPPHQLDFRKASELYPDPLWDDPSAIAEVAKFASEIEIDSVVAGVDIGIIFRNHSQVAASRTVLERLCEAHPESASGWFERAALEFSERQYVEAIILCLRALELAPGIERFVDLLIKSQLCAGSATKAVAAAQLYQVRSGRDARHSALMNQFASYVGENPKDQYLALLNTARNRGRYIEFKSVEQRIAEAIRTRSPFCLLRLGDGEGAWLRLSANDDSRYSTLYDWNRREFLRIWFGSEAPIDDPLFWQATEELCQSLDEVDIVGVSYPARLVHEYAIMSTRGVPSCVNVLKRCQRHLQAGIVCTHDIHLDLQITGGFARLLRNHPDVVVVSCHPGLGAVISDATGANVTETLLIPGEHGFRNLLEGVEGQHFPTRYLEVRNTISTKPQNGRLYLVAAGILGKLYCLEAKRAGGIAIDIGSIADGWMGRITRPTLQEAERFRLTSSVD